VRVESDSSPPSPRVIQRACDLLEDALE